MTETGLSLGTALDEMLAGEPPHDGRPHGAVVSCTVRLRTP
jgi:hypothetical protein